MAEIWDLVDEQGNKTGIKWSRADHSKIPEGLYHPCVEVWVKVGDRVLITRRHPDKSEGDRYDCPGGAVLSGESMIEGALRELREEVGITATVEMLTFLGAVTSRVAYAASYLLSLDSVPDISLQPFEVVGYKLVGRGELEKMADELTRGTNSRFNIYKDRIF